MPRIESWLLPLPDGRHVRVRDHGDGQGLPCLFIHGFAEGAHVWDPFLLCATSLASQRQVSIDLPGHGDSSWAGPSGYDRHRLVADLLHVVERLGVHRMVLVGHSLGGNLAMRMAAQLRDRVAGLVVVDTAPRPSPLARRLLLQELSGSLRPYASVADYVQHVAPSRPLAQEKTLRYLAVNALKQQPDGSLALKVDPRIEELLMQDDVDDLWPVVDSLRCPAMVIRGGMSGVLSLPAAQELADRLRAVDMTVVPGAGHAVMLDQPFAFRDSIVPFMLRASDANGFQPERVAAPANGEATVLG